MRRLLLVPVLFICIGHVRADVHESVVVLTSPTDGLPVVIGAGVVVGSNDRSVYIVTAAHVVEAPDLDLRVQFYAARGKPYGARVLPDSIAGIDLAIVAVDLPANDPLRRSLQPLLYRTEAPEENARLSNVGHAAELWERNVGSTVQRLQRNAIYFSRSGIAAGSSGGPLLDEKLRLVGIVKGVDAVKATAVNVAAILDFLTASKIPTNLLADWKAPRLPPDPRPGNATAVFVDRFDDNRNGWETSTDPDAPAHIAGGVYVLSSKMGGPNLATVPVALDPDRDFEVRCTVTKVRGLNSFFYGLVWGFKDEDHFFNFALTADGHVAITKKVGTFFKDYYDTSVENPHVRKFDATNRLSVRKVGRTLAFAINGHLVHEMPYQDLFGKHVGFIVWQDIQLAFDDLEVLQTPAAKGTAQKQSIESVGSDNLSDMPEMTNTCFFMQGPRAGQTQRFPSAAAIPIGSGCHDGKGSSGVAISERGIAEPPAARPPEDPLQVFARKKDASVLSLGQSAKGSIAEGGTVQYAFRGTKNMPLLFSLQQSRKARFRAKVDIVNANGLALLKNQNFYMKTTEISFVPPRDDFYVLHVTGTRDFGDYVIELTPLQKE